MSTSSPAGIVTPEAVVLDLQIAGIATRSLARLLDLMIQGVLVIAGILVAVAIFGSNGAVGEVVALLVWVFVVVLIAPAVCESLWNGRSPGKAALGLRVVTLDGGPVTVVQAIVRSLLGIVDVYAGLGILPMLANRRSQRFGDLLAGTFVLNERSGSAAVIPTLFYPPPGCEQWVYTADVGRLGAERYRLVRSFLLRVSELDGDARYHLALRLATPVRALVSPDPPHWMVPELYLVCVASAYQLRTGAFPAAPTNPPGPPVAPPYPGYPPVVPPPAPYPGYPPSVAPPAPYPEYPPPPRYPRSSLSGTR